MKDSPIFRKVNRKAFEHFPASLRHAGGVGPTGQRGHSVRIDPVLGKIVQQIAQAYGILGESSTILGEKLAQRDGLQPPAVDGQSGNKAPWIVVLRVLQCTNPQ
jgi:hypothetical protein